MDGKYGILDYMKKRIQKNGICVVVIAEGAGQVSFYLVSIHCAFFCDVDSGKLIVNYISSFANSNSTL
jgi:hypothetical protein